MINRNSPKPVSLQFSHLPIYNYYIFRKKFYMSVVKPRSIRRKPELDAELYRVEVFLQSDDTFKVSYTQGKTSTSTYGLVEKRYTRCVERAQELCTMLEAKYSHITNTLGLHDDYASTPVWSPLIEEYVILAYKVIDRQAYCVSETKPVNHRKKWTPEHKEIIREAFKETKFDLESYRNKIQELQYTLGRTFASIQTQAFLLELFTREESMAITKRDWFL